ncbi:MAG TPA: hypothetical protein ENK63_02530, partial [Rhodobacterales bacterium]|nr:hypothetical protein [Rhodobacterales bacterium]
MQISASLARYPRSVFTRPFSAALALFLAAALALATAAPQPAEAQGRKLGRAIGAVIVGGALLCATNPAACGARGSGRRAGGGGPVDAIALDQTQAMWVQEGLRATGFYFGAIDGAIGAGTRGSIREYQAAVGDAATGALTGEQINDLVALSPTFTPLANDPVQMFNADLANDLGRDGVYQLQVALNAAGYNAGVPDGAFGGNTRNAIAAYKASRGLPGASVASRRLLAQMTGGAAPQPAGLYLVAQGTMPAPVTDQAGVSSVPSEEVATPAPSPVAVPAPDLTFDLLGVTLGLHEPEVKAALSVDYGTSFPYETAPKDAFGGNDKLTTAGLAVQPAWPTPGSEQMLALYDATRRELGAIAIFRLIKMPEGIDQEAFEAQVLPGIIEKYGADAMFGNGRVWIGGGAARTEAR